MGRSTGEPQRDLLMMIDSSGSIPEEIFEAAKATVPIVFQMAKAQGRRFGVVTFSTKTLYSGWLSDYSPRLLSNVLKKQGAASMLNPTIFSALESRDRNYDAILVTDGILVNQLEVGRPLERSVLHGNSFYLLELTDRSGWNAGATWLYNFMNKVEKTPTRRPNTIKAAIVYRAADILF